MEQTSPGRQPARAPGPGAVNTLTAFRAVPSGAALGAEIRGVDFSFPT